MSEMNLAMPNWVPDVARNLPARFVAIGVLTAVLFGLFVHYGAVADEEGHATTQSAERLLASPAEHTGEQLYFWGTVTTTTQDSFEVSVDDRIVGITGSQASVEPGDVVQIVGTLQKGGVVTANRIVISQRANLEYLYVVSAIGLLVALGVFGRSWTINWDSLHLTERGNDDG